VACRAFIRSLSPQSFTHLHVTLNFIHFNFKLHTAIMKKMPLLARSISLVHAYIQDYVDEQAFKFEWGRIMSMPLSDLKLNTTYGIALEATDV
jgi:hypothetical protein